MTTQISTDNIQAATLATIGSAPRITSVVVTDLNYNNLDDTAVDTAGGFVKIIGSGFKTGCTVTVNRQQATSVTFISATELRAQLPAETAGTYVVYVVNTDGSVALRVNGVTFSALPAWTTSSTLPSGDSGTAVSIQLAAQQATQYSLAGGSTLPPGLTLSSGGLLSGTVNIANETLYNFSIVATDTQLQDSPRTFSITITVGDPFFAATTLLLPGSANTFVRDASTNNFPVSVVGDTRPNTFNPYLTGWSNFFDGTGDYLNTTTSSLGSGNFTIECYAYITGGLSNAGIFHYATSVLPSVNTGLAVAVFNSSGSAGWTIYYGNGSQTSGGALALNNTWYHLALVRSGTSLTLYVNGSAAISVTDSTNYTGTAFAIGGYYSTGYLITGNLSNFRVTNSAVYTTAFTPPTAPLTAIAGTILLTCQSNRLIDASSNNFTITRNGDVAVDSFSPFVEPATTNGSGFFDGSGDYITAPANTALQLTGDFTVEAWIYPTAINNFNMVFGSDNGASSDYLTIRASTIELAVSNTAYPAWTQTFIANQWYHVAITRQSNTLRAFVNGVQLTLSGGSATNSSQYFQSGAGVSVGRYGLTSTPHHFTGYISNARIVKGTALYTASFTPPIAPLTAVANTSLLTLQTNQPHNNSQFLDSSSENHLITRAGNATQGSFSPYSPSGWSNFFDGAGDYLSTTSNSTFALTGDFTVEIWVYPTAAIGSYRTLIATGGSGSPDQLIIGLDPTINGISMASVSSGNGVLPEINQWSHIAVSRTGTSVRFFLNGIQQGTTKTSSATALASSTTLSIGYRAVSADGAFTGYISNVRVIKGTALYTANFTLPSQPLTAIPGTRLLTCCDNRFVDDSPNNLVLTRSGDVRVTNFSPFRAVTQTPNTYSAYFDGSGDYLTLPSNQTQFTMGTGDFTIEMWVNVTSFASERTLYDTLNQSDSTGTGRFAMRIPTDASVQLFTGSGQIITSGGTLVAGVWNHIAYARQSGNGRLYINGIQVNTTNADSRNYVVGSSNRPVIGVNGFDNGTGPMFGYISNLRVVKGTAVYTANFTPPTQPLTAVANTSLLTCQSATFVDNSVNRFAVTAVGNSQPSMLNPFGFTFTSSTGYSAVNHSGSMSFDGIDDFLTIPSNVAFGFGTGDFTIECWLYPTNASFALNQFYDNRASSTTDPRINIGIRGNKITYCVATTIVLTSGNNSIIDNAWQHFVLVRSSGSTKIYINGTQSGPTYTDTNNFASPAPCLIGHIVDLNAQYIYKGLISNLRVVKGQALYTSNFVPPLAPVQPVQNTTLLLNGTGAAITDATTKNVLETVGDVRVSSAVSRTGGSSMFFDGTGDFLTTTMPELGTGSFTVEFWFYPTDPTRAYLILDKAFRDGNFSLNTDYLNAGAFYLSVAGSSYTFSFTPPIVNQWNHIAISRNSSSLRFFLNGVQLGSTQTNSGRVTTGTLYIGGASTTGSGYLTTMGYIQDLRITQAARYTANFTPPTTAFQTK